MGSDDFGEINIIYELMQGDTRLWVVNNIIPIELTHRLCVHAIAVRADDNIPQYSQLKNVTIVAFNSYWCNKISNVFNCITIFGLTMRMILKLVHTCLVMVG